MVVLLVYVTLLLCLIKLRKMKTDFQILHYIEVRGEAHAPAALLPGKDPKNALNSKLSGHHSSCNKDSAI
jgi:hypothetical protein